MSKYNPAIFEAAGQYVGTKEWPGAKHNSEVLKMYADVGHGWVDNDEVPWCAAYVGAVLAQLGLEHTGSLRARSYEAWGDAVPAGQERPGDVVVLSRGNNPAFGHVAFFVRYEGARVWLRGGNQDNMVKDEDYAIERIVAIRRARDPMATNMPTLSIGSRGPFVKTLQELLSEAGHFGGKKDGIFGPRTEAAVLSLQAASGLKTDGVVGARTWDALQAAQAPAPRDVEMSDLRTDGSRVLSSADKIEVGVGGVAAVGVATQAIEAAEGATGVLDALKGVPWPTVALIVVGALAVFYFTHSIKAARLDDARTGANLKR